MWRQLASLIATLAVAGQPAAAAPLQPTGKWEVQYSDRACIAKRTYADHLFAIRPSPIGQTVRFVVEGPGKVDRVRQYDSFVDPKDGGPPIRASSMIYPLKAKKGRGLMTILSGEEAARVQRSSRFTVWAGSKLAKQVDGLPNKTQVMAADLTVGPTAALGAALGKCIDDLRLRWRIVDGKAAEPFKAAQPPSKLPGLIRADDYPVDALVADQIGTTQAALMIDETGKVVDCMTTTTSGSAAIDAVACQVMQERAVFLPARDDAGHPVRSVALSPPISFRLAK